MNDKTKLVKKAKNDKASRCCWSAYQKRLGKMGLGEMLPNRSTIPPWLPKCNDYQQKLGGVNRHTVVVRRVYYLSQYLPIRGRAV